MKRLFAIAALSLITLAPAVWAIPTEINYQGTLRASSSPSQYPHTDDISAHQPRWPHPVSDTIQATPNVVNGLFSVKLDFQLIGSNTWETITPYIKVTVGNHNPFAARKSLSHCLFYYQQLRGSRCHWADADCPGYGLVLLGMIAMFSASCPAGWDVFTGLQGRFPVGEDPSNLLQFAVGFSSGSLTHSHIVNSHTHTIAIDNITHSHETPIVRGDGTSNDFIVPNMFNTTSNVGTDR